MLSYVFSLVLSYQPRFPFVSQSIPPMSFIIRFALALHFEMSQLQKQELMHSLQWRSKYIADDDVIRYISFENFKYEFDLGSKPTSGEGLGFLLYAQNDQEPTSSTTRISMRQEKGQEMEAKQQQYLRGGDLNQYGGTGAESDDLYGAFRPDTVQNQDIDGKGEKFDSEEWHMSVEPALQQEHQSSRPYSAGFPGQKVSVSVLVHTTTQFCQSRLAERSSSNPSSYTSRRARRTASREGAYGNPAEIISAQQLPYGTSRENIEFDFDCDFEFEFDICSFSFGVR